MNVALHDTVGLLGAVRSRVASDSSWEIAIKHVEANDRPERAHLAVMHEPYLSYILAGRKTVESRFSRYRIAPYGQVGQGDVLLFKLVSGPVSAVARVADASFYKLDPATWASIRGRFSTALCADGRFWEDRQYASYATLIRIACAMPIEPLSLDKRDRRPWVVLTQQATANHGYQLSWFTSDASRLMFVKEGSNHIPRGQIIAEMPPYRRTAQLRLL